MGGLLVPGACRALAGTPVAVSQGPKRAGKSRWLPCRQVGGGRLSLPLRAGPGGGKERQGGQSAAAGGHSPCGACLPSDSPTPRGPHSHPQLTQEGAERQSSQACEALPYPTAERKNKKVGLVASIQKHKTEISHKHPDSWFLLQNRLALPELCRGRRWGATRPKGGWPWGRDSGCSGSICTWSKPAGRGLWASLWLFWASVSPFP